MPKAFKRECFKALRRYNNALPTGQGTVYLDDRCAPPLNRRGERRPTEAEGDPDWRS